MDQQIDFPHWKFIATATSKFDFTYECVDKNIMIIIIEWILRRQSFLLFSFSDKEKKTFSIPQSSALLFLFYFFKAQKEIKFYFRQLFLYIFFLSKWEYKDKRKDDDRHNEIIIIGFDFMI